MIRQSENRSRSMRLITRSRSETTGTRALTQARKYPHAFTCSAKTHDATSGTSDAPRAHKVTKTARTPWQFMGLRKCLELVPEGIQRACVVQLMGTAVLGKVHFPQPRQQHRCHHQFCSTGWEQMHFVPEIWQCLKPCTRNIGDGSFWRSSSL